MFIPLERRNNKYPEVTLKALENCCTISPSWVTFLSSAQFRHRVLISTDWKLDWIGTTMSTEDMREVSFLKTLCTDSITDQILLQNA